MRVSGIKGFNLDTSVFGAGVYDPAMMVGELEKARSAFGQGGAA